MLSFWAQVETVETTGRGSYPDGSEELLLCREHDYLYTDLMQQPAWWVDDMLQMRQKKIMGDNYRAKKAKRKHK
jgi:hypothetical protein